MPCDNEKFYVAEWQKPEKLAEKGLSPNEIADLQARVNLAREKAKAKAFADGTTLEQQKRRISEATRNAVIEWHREQHALLEKDLELIRHLAKVTLPDKVTR